MPHLVLVARRASTSLTPNQDSMQQRAASTIPLVNKIHPFPDGSVKCADQSPHHRSHHTLHPIGWIFLPKMEWKYVEVGAWIHLRAHRRKESQRIPRKRLWFARWAQTKFTIPASLSFICNAFCVVTDGLPLPSSQFELTALPRPLSNESRSNRAPLFGS